MFEGAHVDADVRVIGMLERLEVVAQVRAGWPRHGVGGAVRCGGRELLRKFVAG